MKKIHVLNVCILLVIFLTAGIVAKPEEDSYVIENLIKERIEVLNDHYRGNCNFDETRDRLKEIESGTLLKTDIEKMKEYQATDMDMIRDYKTHIKSIENTSYSIIKGYAEISWVMETYDGLKNTKGDYFFTGEKNEKTIKITQLKKI